MIGTSKSIWGFDPRSIPGCTLWLDGADNATMDSTTAVTVWNDKSGQSNTMTGTGTWSGGTMVFNGTTNAFSNTLYSFPFGAYSMFAVYSNTTAPASNAYMNAVYGSNGFPMMGTFGPTRDVSARSVVANTGALARTVPVQLGWAARIAGTTTSSDVGWGIATDASGNVFVTGQYGAALTIFNQGPSGTAGTTLSNAGGTDCFVAKYSPAGTVLWAAQIASTAGDQGFGIATDPSGNVLVTGSYSGALTVFNQGPSGTVGTTLSNVGGNDCFVAKYSTDGAVLWAARIAGTTTSSDIGYGIASDSSGNVLVTGQYGAAVTFSNQGPSGTAGTTLSNAGGTDCFVAKYSPAGTVLWAAQIASTAGDQGFGIATDPSGNVLVTGFYQGQLTIYNQGPSGTAGTTLGHAGAPGECFVAKYNSAGAVLWAARIAGTSTTASERGRAIATDASGNVFVTGGYSGGNGLTLYNQSGTVGATLVMLGVDNSDCFVAKYSSAGAVLWAARIAGESTGQENGLGIATDPSGNVLVTGNYGTVTVTIYNQGPSFPLSTTLSNAGVNDCFVAKYSTDGIVLWAARIASTASDIGRAIATDPSGNVLVTGDYGAALTVYNQGPTGTAGTTLPFTGGFDVFIVKYSPDGIITNAATSASSNVLVSATYTPSTFSPFVNGFTQNTLAGTTLTTTGLFLGGPSNYFSGSISEVLIYGTTLTAAQRQSVEGYLSRKWGIGNRLITTHPFYTIPPFNRYFNPTDVPGCSLWLDGADGSSLITGPAAVANSSVATTLAGSGTAAFADGTGAAASFSSPWGAAVLPNNKIVVGDSANNRIRIVTYPEGVVTTLAGVTNPGSNDGAGITASFFAPQSVASLQDGNIAVVDYLNTRIRIVTYPGGVVSTLTGTIGVAYWTGVAVLPNGNLITTDGVQPAIRLVTYPGGVVTVLAGNFTSDFADGTGTNARFIGPSGIAVLLDGKIVVADGSRIRIITTSTYGANSGVVTTLAGSGTFAYADGTGTGASFVGAAGVAVLPDGNIIVTEISSQRVRHVTYPGGVVTTIAGSGTGGFADGTGAAARFGNLYGVGVLSNGIIVASDTTNRIRLITPPTLGTAMVGWSDKSGLNNTMTGTATWTGTTMSFNGSTQAFSNTAYVFPASNYSMFGVYSNTTAPASNAYMNAVYGSDGFPMLGTFGTARDVSARSVVANTGALGNILPVGWAARIAGFGSDQAFAVATDPSGNVLVTGQYTAELTVFNQGPSGTAGTTLPFTNIADCFVAKYSPAGAVLWAARITTTSTGSETGNGIATDASGNVYVTGTFDAAVTIYNQGPSGTAGTTLQFTGFVGSFVAKYSSAGAVLWAARIAGGGDVRARAIATDTSGNVVVTGDSTAALTVYNQGPSGTAGTTLPFTGSTDCFVAKYSTDGAVLWAARIAGTTTSIDFGSAIATDTSGNVLVTGWYTAALTVFNQGPSGTAGTTLPFTGGYDCFVAKYSSAGAVLWAARIASATTSTDVGYGIATDTSGNVLVTGSYGAAITVFNQGPSGTAGTTLPFGGGSDCFVAKYSSAGAVLWAARIASTGTDAGSAIATDTSGNVVVTGYYGAAVTFSNQGPSGTAGTTLPITGSNDCFVAKYSSAGAVLWAARIAGTTTSDDRGNGIATDSSGNVVVAGRHGAALTISNQGPSGTAGTTLPFVSATDGFVAKYNPDGFIIGPAPASSNVLVSATYAPSTFSPFVNGITATTLAGTTLATTGIFVGGPSNYFNGTISELLIYSSTLSAAQRQQVEGYLIQKWGLSAQTLSNHQYKFIPPATSQPAQFNEVTPGNWVRDWQPELQPLIARNNPTNATVIPTISYGTGGPALSPALSTEFYWGGVLAPNGNIYCVPSGASNILIINPTTNAVSYGTNSLSPALSTQVYRGGVLTPNGNIYCMPWFSSNILIINPTTNAVSYGTGGPALSPALSTQGYVGGVLAPNGNIYCVPHQSSNILIINPTTNAVSYGTGGPALSPALSAQSYHSGVLAPNGNIYCAPRLSENILIINPTTGAVSYGTGGFALSPSLSAQVYFGAVLAPNGNIYFTPDSASNILILNPTTNAVSYGTGGPALSPALSTQNYPGGVLAPNGNIYVPSSSSSNILIINPTTNAVSYGTGGPALSPALSTQLYRGGVLAPNGNIYCVPSGASNILIISNTYSQLPSSNYCLSTYANKY